MKYGLKSILRTPVKTVLFILLISVVTGFLSLGVGIYDSAEKMLQEADEVFKTAGEFIYTGGYYPQSGGYDKYLAGARESFNIDNYITDGVVSLEQSVRLRGSVDNYTPQISEMPRRDYSVLTVTALRLESSGFVCRVDRVHYQTDERTQQGFNIVIWPEEYPSLAITEGRQYVVFGETGTLPALRDAVINNRSFTADLGIPEGYGVCDTIFDITACDPDEFWQSDAGEYFKMAIEKLETENNAEDLVVSLDIASVSPFHKGGYTLIEGEFPTDHTESACIIPERMAAFTGIGVGGDIAVSIHHPAADGGLYDTYQPQEGFAAEEVFKVTGIYRSDDNTYAIYALDSGQPWIAAGNADYNLARVVVKNRESEAYYSEIKDKIPADIGLELFDQGYEAATHAVYNMRETVSVIIITAAAVGFAVLWFFAYLFVFRAKESVRVLLRLGAGTKRTLIFLLSGSGIMAIFAGLLGCVCGYLISGRVIDSVYASSAMSGIYDYRFSILSRGAGEEIFEPNPQVSWIAYAIVFAGVIFAAVALCLILGLAAIRSQSAHLRYKKTAKSPVARGSEPSASYDLIPGVPLRYTARSIIRGGSRSLVVPVLFTVMLLFVFVFSRVQNGYRRELDSVYNDVPVNLWLSNVRAVQNGVNISQEDILRLQDSGFVKDSWYADDFRYMNLGLVSHADGTAAEEPPRAYSIPTWIYSYETFEEQVRVLTGPLSAVKNFSKTPEFIHQPQSAVIWAEGMDPQSFETGSMFDGSTPPVLISKLYANESGLELNDVVRLAYFYVHPLGKTWEKLDADFRVAGIYSAGMNQATIIIPDYMNITNYIADRQGGTHTVYNSAGFTVSEPERLSEFKDWLEEDYDLVGKVGVNRRWVVLDDKALYNTIENLTRYIGYMNMLYPVMMAVVAAIGFIASSLLLKSRGSEIAALRSLGARIPQVLSAFFMEPVLLSVPGIALGVTAAVVFLGFTVSAAISGVPLLALCYYLGAAAAAVHTYRKAVMVSLKSEE